MWMRLPLAEFRRLKGEGNRRALRTRTERQPPAFVHTGFESTFRRAGFSEIARRSPARPILRRKLAGRTPARTSANIATKARTRG